MSVTHFLSVGNNERDVISEALATKLQKMRLFSVPRPSVHFCIQVSMHVRTGKQRIFSKFGTGKLPDLTFY
jgi:hypothetical protein